MHARPSTLSNGKPKRRQARLPRRAVPSNCICRCGRMRASSLPPMSSSLTHAHRMDGFCNQNADQLGSLAGQSLLTVYVGVVECVSASPYTYSSFTHRFPDDTHLLRLRLFQRHLQSLVWVWVWVWDWIHSHTPHAPLLARFSISVSVRTIKRHHHHLDTLLSHTNLFPRVH